MSTHVLKLSLMKSSEIISAALFPFTIIPVVLAITLQLMSALVTFWAILFWLTVFKFWLINWIDSFHFHQIFHGKAGIVFTTISLLKQETFLYLLSQCCVHHHITVKTGDFYLSVCCCFHYCLFN